MRHMDLILENVKDNGGNLVLTGIEIEAVRRTKRQFADALAEIGKLDAFADCTAEQIESVIAATWSALRAHMDIQTIREDEVPF